MPTINSMKAFLKFPELNHLPHAMLWRGCTEANEAFDFCAAFRSVEGLDAGLM